MNRKESIYLCNKGIEEKRKGNHDKALEFYLKAGLEDPTNQDIYYNSAKIFLGLEKLDEAIKNLLTYFHLTIYHNTTIESTSGKKVFNSLIGFENNDPIKQALYMQNLELFNYKNKYGNNVITDRMIIPDGLVNLLCIARPPLQLCVLDHNLSFHAGLCYILDDKIIQIFNDISESELNDLKNGLLAKQYKNLLRSTYKENLFLVLGFLYLAINFYRIKNPIEIPDYYLNKELQIKKDIQNYQVYLDSPTSF